MSDYSTLRMQASEALNAGNAQEAFSLFRHVLRYPGAPELAEAARWKENWEVFARIITAMGDRRLGELVRRATSRPGDVKALYALGYQLIEQSAHELAATVLLRAYRQLPSQEPVLFELIAALEGMGNHAEAVRILREQPERVENHFMCRYLLTYNELMSGNLDEARHLFPGLEALLARVGTKAREFQDFSFMVERIRQMLARADAVRGATPLDLEDLRGWHFVVSGGVLLHLSPYGFKEGMRGRYAFLQDSEELCLEGIRRVGRVLAQTGRRPPRVFVLPDRDSAILAHATARVLGLPAVPWPEQGSEEPGLIVAYDLGTLEKPLLEGLRHHHPGQVLWSHALEWTGEPPFTADLTTFLYQMNTSPWGARLQMNSETQQPEQTAPAEGPVEVLAEGVVSASLPESALEDLPVLERLVSAMARVEGRAAGDLFLEQGTRRSPLMDSPVKSSHFT
jgi:hypothetical protein